MYISLEEADGNNVSQLFRQVINPYTTLTWLKNMAVHATSNTNNLTLSNFDTIALYQLEGKMEDITNATQQLKDAAMNHHNAFDRGSRMDLPEITVHHIWTPEETDPDHNLKRGSIVS